MDMHDLSNKDFNKHVMHPLQSYEWGEFREKTGVKVVRENGLQVTIHPLPKVPYTIGYFPKGPLPDKEQIQTLRKIGRENNAIFVQLEPNVIKKIYRNEKGVILNDSEESQHSNNGEILRFTQNDKQTFEELHLTPSAHPLFTKYTFVLDISKSEEELLANMHAKWRYNIRVAQKHNVEVQEDNSDKAFEEYLRLTNETTTRQKFYAHSEKYHRLQWETLPHTHKEHQLSSHLLTATYNGKTLVAWIVFVFNDTLYYPYGASNNEHREVMASNLMMWEAIKFGKRLGLKKFDMWGAMDPNPDTKDPWYGFHRFKQGYGGDLVEFVGSYDLVLNPLAYQLYKLANKARWLYLRVRK